MGAWKYEVSVVVVILCRTHGETISNRCRQKAWARYFRFGLDSRSACLSKPLIRDVPAKFTAKLID